MLKQLSLVGIFCLLSGVIGCQSLGTGDSSLTDILQSPIFGESLAFGLCPEEYRTVSVINGKTVLGCATVPVDGITCPEGQTLVGIKVTDPTGDRKVEPVCQDSVIAPPVVPDVDENTIDTPPLSYLAAFSYLADRW